MADRFSNNPSPTSALTTLAANITTTTATTMTVASNTGWPSVTTASGNGFVVLIDTEYIRVTDNSSTTWTIVRGIESSTAATHSSGTNVWNVYTGGQLEASVRTTQVTAHRHTVGTVAQLAAATLVNGDRWTTTDESTIAASSVVLGNELASTVSGLSSVIPSTNTWTAVPSMTMSIPAGIAFDCLLDCGFTVAHNATVDATLLLVQFRIVDVATSTVAFCGPASKQNFFSTVSTTYADRILMSVPCDPVTVDTVVWLQARITSNANYTFTTYTPTPAVPSTVMKAVRR